MDENHEKDTEVNNTENIIKELVAFEKDMWNKSNQFYDYIQEIDKILDKKESNSRLLSQLSFFISSLENIGSRIYEQAGRVHNRIERQQQWCAEEQDLKTFDLDHTIPLQNFNPLRDAIGIDERWIIVDNAKKIDEWITSRSYATASHETTDPEIYKKLKAFIEGQNVGRKIYGSDGFTQENRKREGHVHPLSFLRRFKGDEEELFDFGDWDVLFYNKAIGDKLAIDHEIEFEFGFLSIPYADPLPAGVNLVALLRRKGFQEVFEVTAQRVPFKFWHPDTNAWLVKIALADYFPKLNV